MKNQDFKALLESYAQCRAQHMTQRETAHTLGISIYRAWHWNRRIDIDSITSSPAYKAGNQTKKQ